MPKKRGHGIYPPAEMGPVARSVMAEFGKGQLRTSTGETVTDPEQAFAIAQSEQRRAKKQGSAKRTVAGRTRLRPKLTSRGKKMKKGSTKLI